MESRAKRRKIRHLRIRKKISGTPSRPRVSIFKSNRFVSVQLIDDINKKTLTAASTKTLKLGKTVANCFILGEVIAEEAKKKGITEVVFDTSGYKYHGRLAAIAESMRKSGIKV